MRHFTDLIAHIQPRKRPYHAIPIIECGEPLLRLNAESGFVFEDPHPYRAAGAPYGEADPFALRAGIAQKLQGAQTLLQSRKPGWRIKIFDGYRPVAVQAYMVAQAFCQAAEEEELDPYQLTDAQRDKVNEKVYRLWGPPNTDPLAPPSHSTGAAVDCTLVDEAGREIDMGSPIDFNGEISSSDYFAAAPDASGRAFHQNRTLLHDILHAQGFMRHPEEWWHFSFGDQYWAWLRRKAGDSGQEHAIYGRVE
jgi:D-alanyl-D-alanine dipeptidase